MLTDAKASRETTNCGRVRAIGVGGAIVGTRADLIVIGDPIKGRAEAESLTSREHEWNWYASDLSTRFRPGGVIAFIATPYSQDDLMGCLLHTQSDSWRVLKMPAIAGENDQLRLPEGDGYGERLAAIQAEYERDGQMHEWWGAEQSWGWLSLSIAASLLESERLADDGTNVDGFC